MKYYGVRRGKDGMTGKVFESWDECKPYVIGVPGAEFKSFSERHEAEAFAGCAPVKAAEAPTPEVSVPSNPDELRIFVDGSFNPRSNVCGYGVYIQAKSGDRVIYGSLPHSCGGRNIEGEVAGALAAMDFLKEYKSRFDVPPVTVYHDYEGIGKWADRRWNTSKDYTRGYARVVDETRRLGIDIKFSHVDGHTGVLGNEYVDVLAKEGCGVPLTKAERERLEEVMGKARFTVKKDREAFAPDPRQEEEQLSLFADTPEV